MGRGLFSLVKSTLVPTGRRPWTVRFGLLRGLTLPLDLQDQLQIYLGTWEREHYEWTHRLSRGIATYVDVGAKRGLMTAYGVARTDATRVLAFEPASRFHKHIRESAETNVREEHAPEVSVHGRFVSNKDDESHITLNQFREEIEYPCFLKIDVDGGEKDVLEGAKQLLEKGDVRILLETHSEELENGCQDTLSALGFETHVIDNAWWRFFLPERRPTTHNRWLVAYKPDCVHTGSE